MGIMNWLIFISWTVFAAWVIFGNGAEEVEGANWYWWLCTTRSPFRVAADQMGCVTFPSPTGED
jgi:hypothetical protein